jgi:DNA-binding MarR family transcriptional regulator
VSGTEGLDLGQYQALARFRFEVRRFLAFSEAAALAEGLPAQQHQALLAIAGRPPAEPASVGDLAEQLLIAPHSAAELTRRMVEAGLIAKATCAHDRRRVELGLTPKGLDLLSRLTAAHVDELRTLGPALISALQRATDGDASPELHSGEQQQ